MDKRKDLKKLKSLEETASEGSSILLSEDYKNIKICPRCSSKLKKYRVIKNNDATIIQRIVCKNLHCKFQREIIFNI